MASGPHTSGARWPFFLEKTMAVDSEYLLCYLSDKIVEKCEEAERVLISAVSAEIALQEIKRILVAIKKEASVNAST